MQPRITRDPDRLGYRTPDGLTWPTVARAVAHLNQPAPVGRVMARKRPRPTVSVAPTASRVAAADPTALQVSFLTACRPTPAAPIDLRPVRTPVVAVRAIRVAPLAAEPIAMVVRPVASVVARRVDPSPLDMLADLQRDLRRAIAELDAVPTIYGAPSYSAAHRYNVAIRQHYAGRVDAAKRQIVNHRKVYRIPEVKYPTWKPRPISAVDRKAEQRWLLAASGTPIGWAVPDLRWPDARVFDADGTQVAT